MKLYRRFLSRAEKVYSDNPLKINPVSPKNKFFAGGIWMAEMLAFLRNQPPGAIVHDIPFNRYGYGKYAAATACFALFLLVSYQFCPLAMPLAILVFYWIEAQFLFLFPLLIDREHNPIWRSIQLTRRVGNLYALCNVIPIAAYMLSGLLSREEPLRRWYVGCIAILIWYDETVEHRV